MKFVLILLVLVALIGLFFLGYKGIIKTPSPIPQEQKENLKKENLKTFYENPFDQKSQYVNPFDEQKNPFDVIRADEQNK